MKARNCQNASPGPGLPAAVDAVGGGGGDAPRLDGDAGQAAREIKGIGGLPRSGRPLRLVENPDLDHQILPQPILLTSLRISPSTVSPSARAAKVSAMRCFSTGLGKGDHIVERGCEAALDEGAGAHGQHERLTGARAGAPGEMIGDPGIAAFARTSRAHEPENRFDDALADGQAAHQALRGHQLFRRHGLLRLHGRVGRRLQQDPPLGGGVGVADVDLHDEAVELGFRQRVGAFLLDGVLGGQHMEGPRQVVALARDGDMIFLHRLQQRGLGARAGAVDFVGHAAAGRRSGP